MNVYWFGVAFVWNGLHPIILPALMLNLVPESLKNTYLGGMTFAGLILAMVVQPLTGALSDGTRSRWGRRRPWILAGTLLSLASLAWMAISGSVIGTFLGLAFGYLLLQVANNVAHGPAQGLIPDLVPTERHGLASGIKNLFDMAGLVVTSLVAGQLMEAGNAVPAFALSSAVLLVSTLVTVLGTPEPSTLDSGPRAGRSPRAGAVVRDLLRVDWRSHRDYVRLLVSRFLILLGIYVAQSFLQFFVRDRLGAPNAAEVTGNLLATLGLALLALVFPAGWLSDRMGRIGLNLLAGVLISLGILGLAFTRSIPALYLFGGIIGAATGTFLSVNWALATDLIPVDQAGKYLGLSNLATAGAGAASRLAGPLIDGVNALWPGVYLGYPVLFTLASVAALAGTLFLLRIRKAAQVCGV
jgi:Na+/melibiose symporter-like transporter